MQTVRVLIADDNPEVVKYTSEQLTAEPWITLVGVAPSFPAAAEWLSREIVDVVIFGLLGMGEGPITGMYRMRKASPQTRLIVCSANFQLAEDLLREGVLGYVSRFDQRNFLLEAIRSVMRGERYCSPEILKYLKLTTGPIQITPEERCVLEILSEGMHDATAIAERLSVTPLIVYQHVNTLRTKLHCFNRHELATWYQHHGAQLTPEGTLGSSMEGET